MPERPSSSLFTNYVLENPWPVGLPLLAIAAVLIWLGLREGLRSRFRLGMVLGAVGAVIVLIGHLVTTAGEQGMMVTKALVDAAVQKDRVGGLALFSDDATMHGGSPLNPGFDRDFIQSRFIDLADRHTIDSNRITMLRGATISADEAEVQLACVTTVEAFPYPNASNWILRVRRMPDGEWKITSLTCVSINNQTPPLERIW